MSKFLYWNIANIPHSKILLLEKWWSSYITIVIYLVILLEIYTVILVYSVIPFIPPRTAESIHMASLKVWIFIMKEENFPRYQYPERSVFLMHVSALESGPQESLLLTHGRGLKMMKSCQAILWLIENKMLLNLDLESNFRSFQSLPECIFLSPLDKEGFWADDSCQIELVMKVPFRTS